MELYRPRVLLLHSSPHTRSSWEVALAACETRHAAAEAELAALLGGWSPEVVVCLYRPELAERMRAHVPGARFIHCDPLLPAGVIEAVWQGHEVAWAERSEELQRKVMELVRPQRSSPRRPAPSGCVVSWQGAARSFELIDLSNDGFAFSVGSGDDLEALVPGTALEALVMRRDGVVAVEGVRAEVRRIEARRDDYRVGCELRAPARPRALRERVIADRAQCAGLLHSALRVGALALDCGRSDGIVDRVEGTVDLANGELALQGPANPPQRFDIVDGHFELAGSSYRFRAAVTQSLPLRIRLPVTIVETQQRSAVRCRPAAALEVQVWSPLSDAPMRRPLFDLATSGLSFDVDPESDLVPPGLRLYRLELVVGGERLRLSGRVRNLVRVPGGYRCGVALDPLDDGAHRGVTDAIVRERFPMLEDARAVDFDELWSFFRDTGFVDPVKEAILAPVLSQVRTTFAALRSQSSRVARSIIVREEGQIVGHVAGLRAYRRTWMLHHLAAVAGKQAGGLVSQAVMEYLVHDAEFEHVRMWFLAGSRFPVRAFGGFARKVADPQLSDLRRWNHFVVPVERRFDSQPLGFTVREAEDAELALVERHLLSRERPLLVRAEDLTRGGLRLDEIDALFRSEGLQRLRRILVARREGVVLGFALLELSSCGLNLSDATSSFRLFVLPDGEPERGPLLRALLDAVLPLYAQTGRRFARCLLPPPEADDYRALAIDVDEAESLCWTFHRTQFRPFSEHMRRLFALLSKRRARVKLPQAA
jgi:hypothetical protein